MNNSKLHHSSIRRRPRTGVMLAAAAVLALAAPAVAHVVEATLPTFLSRYTDTEEATITDFTTFKMATTFIYFR